MRTPFVMAVMAVSSLVLLTAGAPISLSDEEWAKLQEADQVKAGELIPCDDNHPCQDKTHMCVGQNEESEDSYMYYYLDTNIKIRKCVPDPSKQEEGADKCQKNLPTPHHILVSAFEADTTDCSGDEGMPFLKQKPDCMIPVWSDTTDNCGLAIAYEGKDEEGKITGKLCTCSSAGGQNAQLEKCPNYDKCWASKTLSCDVGKYWNGLGCVKCTNAKAGEYYVDRSFTAKCPVAKCDQLYYGNMKSVKMKDGIISDHFLQTSPGWQCRHPQSGRAPVCAPGWYLDGCGIDGAHGTCKRCHKELDEVFVSSGRASSPNSCDVAVRPSCGFMKRPKKPIPRKLWHGFTGAVTKSSVKPGASYGALRYEWGGTSGKELAECETCIIRPSSASCAAKGQRLEKGNADGKCKDGEYIKNVCDGGIHHYDGVAVCTACSQTSPVLPPKGAYWSGLCIADDFPTKDNPVLICDVENSNKQAPVCECNEGYFGKIILDGDKFKGPCTAWKSKCGLTPFFGQDNTWCSVVYHNDPESTSLLLSQKEMAKVTVSGGQWIYDKKETGVAYGKEGDPCNSKLYVCHGKYDTIGSGFNQLQKIKEAIEAGGTHPDKPEGPIKLAEVNCAGHWQEWGSCDGTPGYKQRKFQVDVPASFQFATWTTCKRVAYDCSKLPETLLEKKGKQDIYPGWVYYPYIQAKDEFGNGPASQIPAQNLLSKFTMKTAKEFCESMYWCIGFSFTPTKTTFKHMLGNIIAGDNPDNGLFMMCPPVSGYQKQFCPPPKDPCPVGEYSNPLTKQCTDCTIIEDGFYFVSNGNFTDNCRSAKCENKCGNGEYMANCGYKQDNIHSICAGIKKTSFSKVCEGSKHTCTVAGGKGTFGNKVSCGQFCAEFNLEAVDAYASDDCSLTGKLLNNDKDQKTCKCSLPQTCKDYPKLGAAGCDADNGLKQFCPTTATFQPFMLNIVLTTCRKTCGLCPDEQKFDGSFCAGCNKARITDISKYFAGPATTRSDSTCPIKTCSQIGCPKGTYNAGCGSGPVKGIDTSNCARCRNDCGENNYISKQCTGSDFKDVTECKACRSTCKKGEYFVKKCSGRGTSDDSICRPCTRSCGVGFWIDKNACDGTGTVDTSVCKPCKKMSDCPVTDKFKGQVYFRKNIGQCTGKTYEDPSSCAACAECLESADPGCTQECTRSNVQGTENKAFGLLDVVGGGYRNTASKNSKMTKPLGASNGLLAWKTFFKKNTVIGGSENQASGSVNNGGMHNIVGGGEANTAGGFHSFIGGGDTNIAGDPFKAYSTRVVTQAFIGGGSDNTVYHDNAAIFGGSSSRATRLFCGVLGGRKHKCEADDGYIMGGFQNTVQGIFTAVMAGNRNAARANYAVVAGGFMNSVVARFGTIGGGGRNTVKGRFGFAVGFKAAAKYDYSAAFAFNGKPCRTTKSSSVKFCTKSFYIANRDLVKIIQQNAGGRRRLSPRRLDVIRERSARGYDLVKMIEDNKNGRRRLLENPDDDPRVKISDWHGREFRKLSKDLGHTLHPIEIEEEAAEHKEHVEKIGVSLDLLESKVQYLQQLVHRVAAVKM